LKRRGDDGYRSDPVWALSLSTRLSIHLPGLRDRDDEGEGGGVRIHVHLTLLFALALFTISFPLRRFLNVGGQIDIDIALDIDTDDHTD
jgi:hypothetical protein